MTEYEYTETFIRNKDMSEWRTDGDTKSDESFNRTLPSYTSEGKILVSCTVFLPFLSPCLHKHIDACGHKRHCLQAPLSNTGLFHRTAQKPQVLDMVWGREAIWRELFFFLTVVFTLRLHTHFQEQRRVLEGWPLLRLCWANSQPTESEYECCVNYS